MRAELPIDPILPELIEALRGRGRAVLIAPPGAGKTTRVPPAILRAGLLEPAHPSLLMLQPRRVAARASAARIADENDWTLGREVGYQVRFERRIGPETRLHVLTEGILTRRLLADPFLEGVGAVILDEFHERSLDSDLALALLREVSETVREDLILVVMSATLDAAPVAEFLGNCPIVRAEGRSHPVAVEYVPFPEQTPIADRVGAAVARVVEQPGDILVFLPGLEEIRRSSRAVEPAAERHDILVLPLHSSLTAEEQERAIRPAPQKKLILATNVAETSLTIEGVRTVIDSGLARFARHDPARGLDRLELGRISRASASQRCGRAGRTAPGRCLRLWAEREDRSRPEFDEPEVRRVDLASASLMLRAWGADPAGFRWFEPPPAEASAAAEGLLRSLGAVDARDGRITPLGRRLLTLPVPPRIGRMLIAAAEAGCLREGAALAALLAERDIMPPTDPRSGAEVAPGHSDLLHRLDLLDEAERRRFSPGARALGVDPGACRRVAQARDELLRLGRRIEQAARGPRDGVDEETLLRLPLVAYPDRVARRREPGSDSGVMVGGRGVRLAAESVVRRAEFFLALDAREDRRARSAREVRVRIASEVQVDWLGELFPEALRQDHVVEFDENRGRALAVDTTYYRDLPIKQDRQGPVAPAEAEAALAAHLAPRAAAFIRRDEDAARLLDRLECLRLWMPELGLPECDDAGLAEVVTSACAGQRRVEDVLRAPLAPLILGRLTHAQARALEQHAPEALLVPSGSRHKLTYEPDRPPVLAVRLQELFGLAETPRVAAGRVPVLLHLLGPNFRPVQVTDDLRSFWTTTYHQVRKDLRARYPKHAWPEDPWSARAEAKGRRPAPGR